VEPADREPRGATNWFVNIRSGTTSRARLADLYKAARPEKWSSIAYVEGIKRQERGCLNGARERGPDLALVANHGARSETGILSAASELLQDCDQRGND
jgi:hypothetical protein